MKMNLGFYQIHRFTYTCNITDKKKKRINNLSKGGRLMTYAFA